MTSIRIEGIEEVMRKIDRFSKELAPTVFEVNMGSADKIMRYARQAAPYRTGALRRSITIMDVIEQRGTVVIVANVPYARFVEWGTSRMSPRPFMQPAVHKARVEYMKELLPKLKGLLK